MSTKRPKLWDRRPTLSRKILAAFTEAVVVDDRGAKLDRSAKLAKLGRALEKAKARPKRLRTRKPRPNARRKRRARAEAAREANR